MLSKLPHLYFIIPVFNESANVPRLLEYLAVLTQELQSEFACMIYFIDDGSTDHTAAEILGHRDQLPVEVLQHKTNQGPGAAFATGFRHIFPQLTLLDWVVTLEGDNTSRLQTLRQMLLRRLEGFEVVLASPYAYGGGITQTSLMRIFLSHVANTLVKELLGIRGILTMSSFFRLYSAEVLMRMEKRYGPSLIESPGFECMVELLAKLIKVEATISEVAMALDGSRREGESKMKVLRTIGGYLRLFQKRKKWGLT
jgi:dolichol-phosphate mannosyltransferase